MEWIKALKGEILNRAQVLKIARNGHIFNLKIGKEKSKEIDFFKNKDVPFNEFYVANVVERSPLVCDIYLTVKNLLSA